ncbi:MAG: carbohydrate kinase, partial [Oscillospiraceae bacterium]|nr:carbohydrate kinase [Oscillospiraceae bacterium]
MKMKDAAYVLAYDVGTTSVKTCLYKIDKAITLLAGASGAYPLHVLPNGGAEQDPESWWQAICGTTRQTLAEAGIAPEAVSGLSFCTQMQGLVLVDKNGTPVRPAMSYMDQRAAAELKAGLSGGITLEGCNIYKLIKSLVITKAAATSVKDPVWKYKWVEKNEPERFARVSYWQAVKEVLSHRCSGQVV